MENYFNHLYSNMLTKSRIGFLSLLAMAVTMTSCEKDEETTSPIPSVPQLEVPNAYVSPDFSNNTTVEYAVRAQYAAFSSYMKSAEVVGVTLSASELNNRFAVNGDITLADITTPYYKNLIENSLFAELVSSAGNEYDPFLGATAEVGGVYGARLLNRRAKETLEEVQKGMFSATFYNHILALLEGEITLAEVDRMVAIYGAHPNFPNTNTAANTPTPDVHIALYAARRDKNDGTGLYTKIRDQFIVLRTAVAAGSGFNDVRDAAVAELKILIEKAIMATVINYGHGAITKLTSSNPTPTTISGGLHDLGEAVGFTHGWKSIPQSQRRITDAQVDEILELLLAPAGEEGEMYRFVTEGVNTLNNISEVINILKNIYGFSAQEVEDFRQNWISIQGR